MDKIATFLWLDDKAEEAAKFYASVFRDGKILDTCYYNEAGPRPKGSVLTVSFEIFGQRFVGLNGGPPHFEMTPAISFLVSCETQEEIDRYWGRLMEGGKPLQCGWITDKYGVTWQVVPRVLLDMLKDHESERVARMMRAMFQMVKLDIVGLQQAYNSE